MQSYYCASNMLGKQFAQLSESEYCFKLNQFHILHTLNGLGAIGFVASYPVLLPEFINVFGNS